MNEERGRRLPVSIESEQAVLGSILIRPECFEQIAGMIDGEDFSREEHKQIFNAMKSMFLKNKTIDPITLVNTLVQDGVYSESGGIEYIRLLSQSVPGASNVREYAAFVKDKALLRRLIATCDEIEDAAYSEEGTATSIVDNAEQLIFALAERRNSRELRHIRDVAQDVYHDLELRAENPNESRGVKTGYSGLDRTLVQLGYGDLVIVGARPAMGKTSFAVNIATNVAKNTGKSVCIFSLEMSAEQLVNRMFASEARVDSTSLRSGMLSPDDWERLAHAAGTLSACEIYLDDTPGVTVTDMKAKLRRMKNLGLVVIDYLQLMQSGRNIDNRVQEVSEISRNLKLMAKELGIPIVCCAQLSRSPDKGRTSKKPMMSDLRDSGSIEQDADMILLLYRDDYYDTENQQVEPSEVSQIEVIVAKNRHGATDTVKMAFDKTYTRFYTIDATAEGEG